MKSENDKLVAISWGPNDPVGEDINDLLKVGQKERIFDMVKKAEPVLFVSPELITPQAMLDGANGVDRSHINHLSFQQIYDKPIEIKWIIYGFLPEGDATMIHGPGGLGKTMFWLYIVMSLASYDPVKLNEYIFGNFHIPKRRCSVILQSETGQASMFNRINNMCDGCSAFKAGLPYIFLITQHDDITFTGEQFSDQSFRDFLVKKIADLEKEENLKMDLLIIDPLISYHGGNENDAVESRAVIDGITSVCQRAKCTPIIIHHAGKSSDTYRGSTARHDGVRSRISLKEEWIASPRLNENEKGEITKRIGKVKCIRVTHEKCNNHKAFKSFLSHMDDKFIFRNKEQNAPPEQMERYESVVQALKDMGGYANSTNALSKKHIELTAVSPSTSKRAIRAAVDAGYIVQEKTNQEGKQTYVYRLSDE